MAPVVLWIDEIEKAFASASAESADGGLSQRMFGTLLSWMQDHRSPIFMVATANNIAALPPELMRKGRFDEVFFVDLPPAAARKQILEIHLPRRKRDPERFELERLAADTDGFSGAELEQLVVSAMYSAFSKVAEVSDDHLLAEVGATRPLSVLMGEKVAQLRPGPPAAASRRIDGARSEARASPRAPLTQGRGYSPPSTSYAVHPLEDVGGEVGVRADVDRRGRGGEQPVNLHRVGGPRRRGVGVDRVQAVLLRHLRDRPRDVLVQKRMRFRCKPSTSRRTSRSRSSSSRCDLTRRSRSARSLPVAPASSAC